MLIVRLLRFFRGYVCFRAAEGFPERFLNLCNRQCIPVWDVLFTGGALTGRTTIQGYKNMHVSAERSGSVLGIEKKCGLPFLLFAYRRRVGLLLGLVIFLCGLRMLSGMVWSIDVIGSEAVPKERILQVFEEQGLRQGISKKGLDTKNMGDEALLALPELIWLSLNVRGSTAVIEVRERLPDEEPAEAAAQNIVAGKAGQLAVLEVYTGSAQAKAGQAVLEGALLAGGVIENKDGTVRFAAADAYAVARVPLELEIGIPRAEDALSPRMQTHYTLRFLWLHIPLGRVPKGAEGDITLVSSEIWAPGGKAMPLALERRSLLRISSSEDEKTDSRLELAAAERFFDTAWGELRWLQVLEQEVGIEMGPEGCAVWMVGAAYENIGRVAVIAPEDAEE